jgi:hypothetical protein
MIQRERQLNPNYKYQTEYQVVYRCTYEQSKLFVDTTLVEAMD